MVTVFGFAVLLLLALAWRAPGQSRVNAAGNVVIGALQGAVAGVVLVLVALIFLNASR